MDARETAEVLGYLSAAYPRNELHEETVLVWIDQFDKTDFGLAVKTAKRIVATDEWFPTIARFREVLGHELRQAVGTASCDSCDNGFLLNGDGTVSFCPRCRPEAPTRHLRASAAGLKSPDWRDWVDRTRKELDNTTD